MFLSQHIYFLSSLIFCALWILVFIINKKREDRKNMVWMGVFTMVLAVFVEPMHLTDWWHPKFISDTVFHLEDILFGFSSGGFISGVYSILSKQKGPMAFKTFQNIYKIPLLIVFFFSLFGLFYSFGVSSFWTSIIALSIPFVVLLFWRIKVLPIVFLNATIVGLVALFGYLFAIYLNPSYIKETYLFNYLSGQLFLGIPIEELCWFFFAGLGISSFQELFFYS